jgi:hypothetical protein
VVTRVYSIDSMILPQVHLEIPSSTGAFPLQSRALPTAFVVQALEQSAGLAPGTSTFLKGGPNSSSPTPFRALRRSSQLDSPRDGLEGV